MLRITRSASLAVSVTIYPCGPDIDHACRIIDIHLAAECFDEDTPSCALLFLVEDFCLCHPVWACGTVSKLESERPILAVPALVAVDRIARQRGRRRCAHGNSRRAPFGSRNRPGRSAGETRPPLQQFRAPSCSTYGAPDRRYRTTRRTGDRRARSVSHRGVHRPAKPVARWPGANCPR